MTVREKLKSLHVNVAVAEKARAEYVAELREEGFSLRELAEVLEVAPSTVMRWGPVEKPSRTLDDEA